MSKAKVDIRRMRYIVPFKYDKNQYRKIVSALSNENEKSTDNYIWKKIDVRKGEQDIYDYVLDAFDGESDNCLGSVFSYKMKKENTESNISIKMSYQSKRSGPYYLFKIIDAGLFVFRTGIGMFWYEIKFDGNISKKELVEFQNTFKELNRWNDKGEWNKIFKLVESKDENSDYNNLKDKNEGDAYYDKFTIGQWIVDVLSKSLGNVFFYKTEKSVITRIVDGNTVERDDVPDKAIIFNYIANEEKEFDKEDMDVVKLAYYMTNGYKSSYKMRNDIEHDMYKPFQNMYWYATSEGVGCYAVFDESNKGYFTGNLKTKIINDYFLIYIHILHQKYASLGFAQQIEEKLFTDIEKYEDSAYGDQIQRILMEIDVFLAKNVWPSISYIHHQNEMYQYVYKRLTIKNNIDSLTEGLEALEKIQRLRVDKQEQEKEKQKEKKRNRVMDFIAIFALVSVFVDGFTFIDNFLVDRVIGRDNIDGRLIKCLYGILVMIFIVICTFLVIKMVQLMGDKKKSLKSKICFYVVTIFIMLFLLTILLITGYYIVV